MEQNITTQAGEGPDSDVGEPSGSDNNLIYALDVEFPSVEEPSTAATSRFRGRSLSLSRTWTNLSERSNPRGILTWLRAFIAPHQHDDSELVPNYRHSPIFAGIIIPFSILLEIPGLTEKWYPQTENPAILDVGLSVSMACALIANICLVGRFLEKRVKMSTILCIIFLSLHDIINVLAIVIFPLRHRTSGSFNYGEAFWMTVCSTIASSATNITLIIDLVRTPNFELSGSGLTRKQRSLVVVIILLFCYIALGALVNLYLIHGLTFVDALYFTVVTIETIGFGDITPTSTGARIFICIYATLGIFNIALAVGMMRDTVLEALEVGYRKRVRDARERRKQAARKRLVETRWREAIQWRLRAHDQPIWVHDSHTQSPHLRDPEKREAALDRDRTSTWFSPTKFYNLVVAHLPTALSPKGQEYGYAHRYRHGLGYGYGNHPHNMHLNLEALRPAQLEAAALEAGVPLDTLLPAGFHVGQPKDTEETTDRAQALGIEGHPITRGGKDGKTLHVWDKEANPGSLVIAAPPVDFAKPETSGGDSEVLSHFLSPQEMEAQCGPSGEPLPLTHARMGRMIAMLGRAAFALHGPGRDVTEQAIHASYATRQREGLGRGLRLDECIDHDLPMAGPSNPRPSPLAPSPNLRTRDLPVVDGVAPQRRPSPLSFQDSALSTSREPRSARFATPLTTVRNDGPSSASHDVGSALENGKAPLSANASTTVPVPLFSRSTAQMHLNRERELKNEERNAFLARLTVVLILFFGFWMVGSAIFMRTEHWTYGDAMYFCFTAFTTIGYGDISPQTPAGRSIFVVWALLGVGTMTILISVVSEAYNDHYESSFHSHVFDTAVKEYRQRQVEERAAKERKASEGRSNIVAEDQLDDQAIQKTLENHQQTVEELPEEILKHVRTFHDQVHYFLGHGPGTARTMAQDHSRAGAGGGVVSSMPHHLQELLHEITHEEQIGDKMKEEIMQDGSARHTLFKLSIERAIKAMVHSAKSAQEALRERQRLELSSSQQQAPPSGTSADHRTTSSTFRTSTTLRRRRSI